MFREVGSFISGVDIAAVHGRMKPWRTPVWTSTIVLICFLLSLNALAGDSRPAQTRHEPITEQLITMVEHNAELRKMLVKSIEMAKKINPDRITNPAQTLEEYYLFIDRAAKALPWSILPKGPFTKLYDQIDQSLDPGEMRSKEV